MVAFWPENKRDIYFFKSQGDRNTKAQVYLVYRAFFFFLEKNDKG